MGCVFCDVRDKGRAAFIYEDSDAFVIPDKFPSARGHALVISKKHVTDMLAADDETIARVFPVAKRIGELQREKLGADSIRITTNVGKESGQIIFHFHVHVIPIYAKPPSGFVKHREITEGESKELRSLLKPQ